MVTWARQVLEVNESDSATLYGPAFGGAIQVLAAGAVVLVAGASLVDVVVVGVGLAVEQPTIANEAATAKLAARMLLLVLIICEQTFLCCVLIYTCGAG